MKEIKVFGDLVNETIVDVKGAAGDDELIFTLAGGRKFKQYHPQDCCESVSISEIIGFWEDIIGEPLVLADEASWQNENPAGAVHVPDAYETIDSFTWTFYKLATRKGSITIRWYGSSNGYYSEGVDFEEIGDFAAPDIDTWPN